MIGVVLVKALHQSDLWHNAVQNKRVVCQDFLDILPQKELGQFDSLSFGGYMRKQVAVLDHGLPGGFFNIKAQGRSKTQGPHDSQGVFLKALGRLSDGPDQSLRQVIFAAKIIHKTFLWTVGNGVDGKISPGDIIHEALGKNYLLWMAEILIGAIDAVGGNFNHMAFNDNADGAMLKPVVKLAIIFKELHHFLGGCGAGKVIVIDGKVQQKIPGAATDNIGGKAPLIQDIKYLMDIVREPHKIMILAILNLLMILAILNLLLFW